MTAAPQKLPDASESSLLRVARSCYEGMKVLASGNNFHSETIIPFGLIAGHCIEAILKCHLLQKGATNDDLKALGHNLVEAWMAAAKRGPPIEGPVPQWVVTLNAGHDKPYMYRYLPHQYGAGCPAPEQFMDQIPPLLKALYKTSEYL